MSATSTRNTAPASCILVADQHGGRLFAGSQKRGSTEIRLEEIGSHANTLIAHDRGGRPTHTRVRRVTFANPDRDHDIMRDQFAADLLTWLTLELRLISTDGTLHLFAPPEFLGALRHAIAAHPLAARVIEHQADLARLPTSRLERHPTIIREVSSAA